MSKDTFKHILSLSSISYNFFLLCAIVIISFSSFYYADHYQLSLAQVSGNMSVPTTGNDSQMVIPTTFYASGSLVNLAGNFLLDSNQSAEDKPVISGQWNLNVSNNKMDNFSANFVIGSLNNVSNFHSYFLIFNKTTIVSNGNSSNGMSSSSTSVSLEDNKTLANFSTYSGFVNVDEDNKERWTQVPLNLSILPSQNMISILLDPTKTNNYFNYQPIIGLVLNMSNIASDKDTKYANVSQQSNIAQQVEDSPSGEIVQNDTFVKNNLTSIVSQNDTIVNNSGSVTETNNSSNLLTYDNPDYGISILYPSNWTKSEENLQSHQVVSFYAPDITVFNKNISPARLSLTIEPISDHNIPISTYSRQFLKGVYPNSADIKILNTSKSTLSGYEAEKIVMLDYLNGQTSKELRVFSIIDGNIYRLGYFAQPGTFLTYLPLIDKMIDSFNVTIANKPAPDSIITNAPAISNQTDNTENATNFVPATNESQFAEPKKSGPSNQSLETSNFVPHPKYLSKWGSLGKGKGQLDHPAGIAVNPTTGEVFIADINNNRIQKFSSDGKFLSTFGSLGKDDGKLDGAGDVAIDPQSNMIYVSDIGNNRIQIFNSDGQFVSTFGSLGAAEGQLNHPGNMAIDSDNKILYVADTGNSRIQTFTLDGQLISSWGTFGSDRGQFNRPAGMAIDKAGTVYVLDTKNNRIQTFDSQGNFISTWGSFGTKEGMFSRPTDILVDEGRKIVFVADTENSRIEAFSTDGNFLSTWNLDPNGGQPTGLALSKDRNSIYVVDKPGNNIQVFSLE